MILHRRGRLSRLSPILALTALLIAACHHHAPKEHRAHAVRLDDGVFRVVVVGDSLAAGTGDPDGKGIPGNLQDELRGVAANVEVKNYGVAGNTTEDVARRLQNEDLRNDVASADAVVLSVGANDVFQSPDARAEAIREPVAFANRILALVAGVVQELRGLNPDAPILILGGYNPIPDHPLKSAINRYLKRWDNMLDDRFASDPRIDIVKLSDIIDGADKLSPIDHFHPGAGAYRDAAHRIADMLR